MIREHRLTRCFWGLKRFWRAVTDLIFPKFEKTHAETGFDRECVSSNPLAPATHSSVLPGFPRDPGMGRKSRLFAHSLWSPDSRFAELAAEIPESLRPFLQIFPFWGDYRRRRVRSGLPPDEGSRFRR